ncbi:MAG TPA: ATPase, partial [Eoetvoesiella sp.]
MLRNLIPRSLRARLILFTLGTIFLVQAATIATVTFYRQKITQEVTVEVTATTIRTLRAALAEIPAEERSEFVRKASQNEWHLWSRSLPAEHRLERRGAERRAAKKRDQPALPNDLREDLRFFVSA